MSIALAALGLTLLLVSLAPFVSSLFYFWTRKRGTLAPWDLPREFVVAGPYRFVRNPMISGVIFTLLGEACIRRSAPHGSWAGIVRLINLIYIPAFEEPLLVARFAEPCLRYRRIVPRFIPRRRP